MIMMFTVSSLFLFQEFQGVVGLEGDATLESDSAKLPERTVQILAACHALVFVENKLVFTQL